VNPKYEQLVNHGDDGVEAAVAEARGNMNADSEQAFVISRTPDPMKIDMRWRLGMWRL